MSAPGSSRGAGAPGARTRLGVLGWPVAHSRSPAMHNAALQELGLHDWHYQLLPVPPELFAETTRALGEAGFLGANVTIPHKQAALALADTASPAAKAIGAANMLTFGDDGTIKAENTDGHGLVSFLPESLSGRSALVLGAGGSARAMAWALGKLGVEDLAIWNRTPERARALARDFGARAVQRPVAANVLVNCTSVGLQPAPDALQRLALDDLRLEEFELVIDLVYRGQGETELLAAARAAGAQTFDGIDLLVAQGAISLELWTGLEAPRELMQAAARECA